MELLTHIRKLGWPLNKIYLGSVLFNKIYLREDIYEDLRGEDPRPENIGVLLHEETHLKRFKKRGLLLNGIKFWLVPSFRYQEEVEADKARFKYLKKAGVKFDFKKRARRLSGFWYLYCVSYNQAIKDLQKAWRELV